LIASLLAKIAVAVRVVRVVLLVQRVACEGDELVAIDRLAQTHGEIQKARKPLRTLWIYANA